MEMNLKLKESLNKGFKIKEFRSLLINTREGALATKAPLQTLNHFKDL